jgi:hypothetical protein
MVSRYYYNIVECNYEERERERESAGKGERDRDCNTESLKLFKNNYHLEIS